MTTIPGRKKSSRWPLWLTLLIACVLVVLFIRYGFLSTGSGVEDREGGSAKQASIDGAGSSKGAADDARSDIRGDRAPSIPDLRGFFGKSEAIPVAFSGVVLNEDDRSPLEGARVRILAMSSFSEAVEKTTGQDGTFTVEAPPGYRYEVKVEAEGFRPYEDDSFVITRPNYSMEILLTPVLVLKGRVLDPQSQGIPDALVGLFTEGRRSVLLTSTTTDSQGAFTFSDISRGGRYQVEAYHGGFDSLGAVGAQVPAEEEIILRMQPAPAVGSLAGLVSDTARKPIAGARISLLDAADGRNVSEVLTDPKGEYRFSRIREGYFLVRCAADGFTQTDESQAAIAISAGKEARLDFSLKAGQQIRGIVVNQKGEPVANATLTYRPVNMPRGRNTGNARRNDPIQQWNAARMGTPGLPLTGTVTTDMEGRFQILGLNDEPYQLNVLHRDYFDFTTRLQPSSQPQTLTLDAALSVIGTASDEQGAPIERFSLVFQSTTERYAKSFSFTTSDGHFEVRGLVRGTYQVQLQASGRERYAGTLELQASTEVLLVTGAPDAVTGPRGGRGGRSAGSLTIIKAR